MNTIIRDLIQEEIRLTGFIRSLNQLGVEANEYLPNISVSVFRLMNIKESEVVLDVYFGMVERGQNMEAEARKELANQIVTYLENCILNIPM